MANKKYKLADGNMWATDGIHDFGQNKTQRTINSEVNSALGGKAPTDHASTATTYGAASTSNYGHVKLSNTTPIMDGTAAVGDSTDVARANHVHPSDTSRVPTTRKINGMDLSQDRTLTSENIGYNSSTTYSSGTVGKAVSDLNGAVSDLQELKEITSQLSTMMNLPTGLVGFRANTINENTTGFPVELRNALVTGNQGLYGRIIGGWQANGNYQGMMFFTDFSNYFKSGAERIWLFTYATSTNTWSYFDHNKSVTYTASGS